MKTWEEKFKEKHGERIYFMRVMLALGLLFFAGGGVLVSWDCMPDVGKGLVGSGVTLLGQVAAIATNKARSPEKDGET